MIEINIVENCGESKSLRYGLGETDFGFMFLVMDENETICYASFINDRNITSEVLKVKKYWPIAEFSQELGEVDQIVKKIFDRHNSYKFNLKLTGTDFQISVWKALANFKEGSTMCYEDVAKAINKPKAVRAVASAIKNNKIAYLIPCHRVISKNGGINEYKWGAYRKLKLLTHEKNIL